MLWQQPINRRVTETKAGRRGIERQKKLTSHVHLCSFLAVVKKRMDARHAVREALYIYVISSLPLGG